MLFINITFSDFYKEPRIFIYYIIQKMILLEEEKKVDLSLN